MIGPLLQPTSTGEAARDDAGACIGVIAKPNTDDERVLQRILREIGVAQHAPDDPLHASAVRQH